ncbi:hypothetical protein D3C71_670350 [compost metagenome]
MKALGVPAGATTLCHATASKSAVPATPDSATVGTAGKVGWRLREVTASARSLPLRTCCRAGAMSVNMSCSWPPSRSVSASALPL